jgi:outer membrane protein TolC
LLKRLGPPEPARRHFDAARLEFLKGLRELLDARIAQCSKRKAKGEKINVE